jgi:sugar lactone lactonase YvrE
VSRLWSPDGNRLLFVSNRDGNEEIYVMDADGTGQTRLTDTPGFERGPTFSPDGAKITYTAGPDFTFYHVWVMDADGGNPTQVTSPPGNNSQPDWQPCDDVILGAGWVAGGGRLASLSLAVGRLRGVVPTLGLLTFYDYTAGTRLVSTSITTYTATGQNRRRIAGTALINGRPGTFVLEVADNGGPGRGRDTVRLALSTGAVYGPARLLGGDIGLSVFCP